MPVVTDPSGFVYILPLLSKVTDRCNTRCYIRLTEPSLGISNTVNPVSLKDELILKQQNAILVSLRLDRAELLLSNMIAS